LTRPTRDASAASAGPGDDPPLTARPAYLHGSHEPFLIVYHPAGARADVGVVICPPFGWEEMSSYRARRAWAQALSERGVAAVRLDVPGAGDSGGYPSDADRLDAWTDSVGEAASWLRHETGCRRVVAICIGVGGLLAWRAAAQGAPIDDLVLWGTPARGRAFIRETSAFSRLEVAQQDASAGESTKDELPTDWLSAGGYVLSADTRVALEGIDLDTITLPGAEQRHALLLERDGISVDSRLQPALERQGVAVETMAGEGFGKMMVEPHFALTPTDVIERVNEWVMSLEIPAEPVLALPERIPRASAEALVLAPDGTPLRESFVAIPSPSGDLFGVLSEPLDGRAELSALLIGGTGHRIGPNRMWVEAARRWAALGVTSLRLDVTGTGDAEGLLAPDVPGLYTQDFTEQIDTAVRALSERGLPHRTVVVGLCAAAYWGVQVALRPEHEVVPFLLNPKRLVWDERRYAEHMARHYFEGLGQASNWRRLFRRELSLSGARRVISQRLVASVQVLQERRLRAKLLERIDRLLDELRDRDLATLIVFAGRESLHEEFKREARLERIGRWPNVTIETVPGRAGLHTLKPIWLQRRVHEVLDEGLRRELARQGPHLGSGGK
jgi:pimeloyl-ACP methyl ester carboxylesterase